MRRAIYLLLVVAIAVLQCSCYEEDIMRRRVNIDVDIKCINEKVDGDYTWHTYLCSGTLSGFKGECKVVIMKNHTIVLHDDTYLWVSGKNQQFSFTFVSKTLTDSLQPETFIVEVCNTANVPWSQTVVAAYDHTASQSE
mgnify:FL=1